MTGGGNEKRRVLVVDDGRHVVAYLEGLLQDSGYETISAADGRAGLELARQEMPDLVILDLMMPRQTGTDFYRNLVKDRELGGRPVIVVSAVPGSHLAVKNPAAIFDKPIDPDAFLTAVARALKA